MMLMTYFLPAAEQVIHLTGPVRVSRVPVWVLSLPGLGTTGLVCVFRSIAPCSPGAVKIPPADAKPLGAKDKTIRAAGPHLNVVATSERPAQDGDPDAPDQ